MLLKWSKDDSEVSGCIHIPLTLLPYFSTSVQCKKILVTFQQLVEMRTVNYIDILQIAETSVSEFITFFYTHNCNTHVEY